MEVMIEELYSKLQFGAILRFCVKETLCCKLYVL
jgi:hypothetical protein